MYLHSPSNNIDIKTIVCVFCVIIIKIVCDQSEKIRKQRKFHIQVGHESNVEARISYYTGLVGDMLLHMQKSLLLESNSIETDWLDDI